MKYVVFFIVLFTLTAATTKSCSNSSKEPCPDDIICTHEFVMFQTAITDKEGNLIQMDSTQTIQEKGGRILLSTRNDGSSSQYGYHLVISDSEKSSLNFNGETIVFRGFLNGRPVISERFTVAGGCCHIDLIDVKKEIQLLN